LGLTGYLYYSIPKGLFPSEDTGFITGTTTAVTDISIPALIELQTKVMDIIRKDKAVDYISSSVGPGGINPTMNKGRMSIALKPRHERGESAQQVIQRLRVTANRVPGISVIFQALQNIPKLDGRITQAEFQYTLQSSDTQALYAAAPEMTARLAKLEGLRDVNSD